MIIVLAPPLLWAPAFSYGSEHTSGIDNVICAGGAPLNGGIVLLQACAVVGDGSVPWGDDRDGLTKTAILSYSSAK